LFLFADTVPGAVQPKDIFNISPKAFRPPCAPAKITGTVANATKDLPGLVRQTQISMREVERLVEAMQRTWLIRKHVNHTNPPPSRPYWPKDSVK
jgi:hypothetical protein